MMLINRKVVDVQNLRPQDVDLEVIGHALSLINRYNGHTPFPYSVAQHSIYVMYLAEAVGFSKKTQLLALLHDATEAYIGDVIRPLKQTPVYEDYMDLEIKVWGAISAHFRLASYEISTEHWAAVKDLDHAVLLWEMANFFSERAYEEYPHLYTRHGRDQVATAMKALGVPKHIPFHLAKENFVGYANKLLGQAHG